MDTTRKRDSPLLRLSVNCCVCGFHPNYYFDFMLKLLFCMKTCLKPFFTGQGACHGDQRPYLQPVKQNTYLQPVNSVLQVANKGANLRRQF
jgi:hypothetical protein